MTTWLILFLLFVKHFLADFVWQTNAMIAEKGQYGKWGGIAHSGLQGALTYVILLHVLNIQACVMLAVFDALTHYHIEWAKMNIARGLSVSDQQYWFWVGLDQLLHSIVYLAIAFVTSVLLSDYV